MSMLVEDLSNFSDQCTKCKRMDLLNVTWNQVPKMFCNQHHCSGYINELVRSAGAGEVKNAPTLLLTLVAVVSEVGHISLKCLEFHLYIT